MQCKLILLAQESEIAEGLGVLIEEDDVSFPWCAVEQNKQFPIRDPRVCEFKATVTTRGATYTPVMFVNYIKPLMLTNDKTVAATQVVRACIARWERLLCGQSFLASREETAVLEDLLAAFRCVVVVNRPGLLADMIYVDALSLGAAYVNSTTQCATFTSAVGNWIASSTSYKKRMLALTVRLDASREIAAMLGSAIDELLDVEVKPDSDDISSASFMDYSKAIVDTLDTVSYSLGRMWRSARKNSQTSYRRISRVLLRLARH